MCPISQSFSLLASWLVEKCAQKNLSSTICSKRKRKTITRCSRSFSLGKHVVLSIFPMPQVLCSPRSHPDNSGKRYLSQKQISISYFQHSTVSEHCAYTPLDSCTFWQMCYLITSHNFIRKKLEVEYHYLFQITSCIQLVL